MSWTARIRDRDDNDVVPANLFIAPVRYSRHEKGGPYQATIRVEGTQEAIWRLLGWLRYDVHILDPLGIERWWGMINGVTVNLGNWSMGVSLDDMANSVAAIWSTDNDGGITAYNTNTVSANEYGTKELLISASDMDETAALQKRDWTLEQRKFPKRTLSLQPTDTISAELDCLGWWYTLGWHYYARDEGLEEYVPGSGKEQKVGMGVVSTELGFQANSNRLNYVTGTLDEFSKGDKVTISGTASNDATVTVATSSQREADTYTATTFAFLQKEKTTTDEYLRASHDVERNLNNANIKSGTVVVTNDGGGTTYTEGAGNDYTIDYTNGGITALSGGSITDNQIIRVDYDYIENRIEDSQLGLEGINAGDIINISGSSGGTNDAYYQVLSAASDGDAIVTKQSVTNEAPGASITISWGPNIVTEEALATELPDGSTNETLTVHGEKIAQQFTVSSDANWTLNEIRVKVGRVGSPSDNMQVSLYTDSSGSPGSSLEAITKPGSDLSPNGRSWETFGFSNSNTLTAGSSGWVVIERTSSLDLDNFYVVEVDETLGAGAGTMKLHDGSGWVARTPDANMPYQLLGADETTTQIEAIISQEGEFVDSHDVIDTSGINTNEYRDGRTTALTELIDLLNIGTTNDRRLLATVTIDKTLRVEEEPAEPSDPDYYWQSDGRVTRELGQPLLDGDLSFVGNWMALRDVIPGTASIAYLAKPSPFFVSEAEYIIDTGEYRIQPRHDRTWRVGMVDEG